ncbi:MAG: indole-3-glycerol phosphate synthase TrpC, partial [Planctomycetota bacterium]
VQRPGLGVIAEVKRASPSRGEIRADFVPEAIAASYERAGAAAISVLTDERYFGGRLEHLEAVRRAVRVPVLRKDFILREYQVWESRAAGADAILLILAAVREDRALAELAARAEELGMDVLWEIHDREELRRVLRFGPRLVGVNNRDLRTFEVSLETTKSLVPELPREVFAVSESGFSSAREIEEVFRAGARGFLVGESLLREADPGGALSRLLGSEGGAPWT